MTYVPAWLQINKTLTSFTFNVSEMNSHIDVKKKSINYEHFLQII